MDEAPDDLEKLLTDVRKTISENKQFLEKLMDETIEDEPEPASEDDAGGMAVKENFEEL